MDTQTPAGINQQRHSPGHKHYPGRPVPIEFADYRQSGSVTSTRTGSRSTHFLIVGVLLLQLVVTSAVLILLAPIESPTPDQNSVDALHLPPSTAGQPALPPPQPFPDAGRERPAPTPSQPIIETASPIPQPTAQPPTLAQRQPVGLEWRGLEITQGIQVFNDPESPRCVPDPNRTDYIFCNNSMPLVAGRHTLVRAYPACNGDCPTTDLTVYLRVFKDGRERASLTRQLSAQTVQQINNLPLLDLRTRLEYSVNFEFFPPPDWMTGPVTFELTINGQDTLTLTRDFAVRRPLRVAYLPIQYQGLTPPEITNIDHWLLRMYPVPAVEYYRLPVPDLVWDKTVNKGELLNKLLFTYWLYAQYQPASQWPDQLFGWLPQEFYNGGVSDPFWCPNCAGPHSSRVAFGGLRPEHDIGGPRILVHEIAHNLGAQHAWSPTQGEDGLCFRAEGTDIQVDPAWPYPETPHIQEFGIDLYSDPPVIYPPAYYDMMAYCYQPWISPFTYRKLFDSPYLQPQASAAFLLPEFGPLAEKNSSGTLLVSGVVYPDGTVSTPEIVRLERSGAGSFAPPAFNPPPGEDYCLDVQATDGSSLAHRCFNPGFADIESGAMAESSPFFFTLPHPERQEIGQITISKNGRVLARTGPSNHPPDLVITFPNGGEVLENQQTMTWTAQDADGDSLHFDLLFSPDGGESWLPLATNLSDPAYTFHTDKIPASSTALIRVVATDGFHTAVDESDAPFSLVANHQEH